MQTKRQRIARQTLWRTLDVSRLSFCDAKEAGSRRPHRQSPVSMVPMMHLAWMASLKAGITMIAPGPEACLLGILITSTCILREITTLMQLADMHLLIGKRKDMIVNGQQAQFASLTRIVVRLLFMSRMDHTPFQPTASAEFQVPAIKS